MKITLKLLSIDKNNYEIYSNESFESSCTICSNNKTQWMEHNLNLNTFSKKVCCTQFMLFSESTLHKYRRRKLSRNSRKFGAKANLNSQLKFRLIKLSASEFISCHDLRALCVFSFCRVKSFSFIFRIGSRSEAARWCETAQVAK